uniref:Uncharacterized protein n=1 Tax=Rhodnius prolixus TaxID=13249 RepID=T1ICB8_RHOPR
MAVSEGSGTGYAIVKAARTYMLAAGHFLSFGRHTAPHMHNRQSSRTNWTRIRARNPISISISYNKLLTLDCSCAANVCKFSA